MGFASLHSGFNLSWEQLLIVVSPCEELLVCGCGARQGWKNRSTDGCNWEFCAKIGTGFGLWIFFWVSKVSQARILSCFSYFSPVKWNLRSLCRQQERRSWLETSEVAADLCLKHEPWGSRICSLSVMQTKLMCWHKPASPTVCMDQLCSVPPFEFLCFHFFGENFPPLAFFASGARRVVGFLSQKSQLWYRQVPKVCCLPACPPWMEPSVCCWLFPAETELLRLCSKSTRHYPALSMFFSPSWSSS